MKNKLNHLTLVMTYLRLFWGIFIFAKELCTFGNAEISCQGVLAGAVWGEDLHDSLDRCFLVGFSCTSFKPYFNSKSTGNNSVCSNSIK